MPPEAIEALRRTLNGEALVPAKGALKILSSRSRGGVHAVLSVMRGIGLDRMLLSYEAPWRKTALGLIAARVLRPGSKLFTAGWWGQTTTAWRTG